MNRAERDIEMQQAKLAKSNNQYSELIEKRREVIDLTAELDRAKRRINEVEAERDIAGRATVEIAFKLANAEKEYSSLQIDHEWLGKRHEALHGELERKSEAWQEKVDSLELELGTKHIYNWYLKPIFMFCAGATTAIIAVAWWIRWYL